MAQGDTGDFPLLEYLDGLVDKLHELMAPAIKGQDADAVHDARVATRRLKAATDLLKPVVAARCRRAFGRVTKCLRKQLGALRDLDVMLEHLEQVKQPTLQDARQWLADRWGQCRAEAVAAAQEKAPPTRMLGQLGSWWGLRHEILEAREKIQVLLTDSIHLQLEAFSEQAEALIHSRRNDPHQLRIAGKSLRYTLEMAKEHGVSMPASILSLFKKMQTALGLWHDYVVLAERILRESVNCDLALHDPQLQERILALAQMMLRKAGQQLRRMSERWETHGVALSEAIRQAFPLTKVAPEAGVAQSPKTQPTQTASQEEIAGANSTDAPAA